MGYDIGQMASGAPLSGAHYGRPVYDDPAAQIELDFINDPGDVGR